MKLATHWILNRQRGVVVPFVAVGLLALLLVAGLALDGSHTLANNTRTQNSVDAAALAAAKVYDETLGDIAASTAAASASFANNAAGAGNHELDDAGITPVVQFSPTLNPFVSSGVGPYVRVRASGFNVGTTLTNLLGIQEIEVAASAVAGPSPTLTAQTCNLAPIIVCSDDLGDDNYGFNVGNVNVLKPRPSDHEEIGSGNYKLLDLECEQGGGGDCVGQHMAGEASVCKSPGETVETKPGATAGPSLMGLNTRFGDYQGGGYNSLDHPPDANTTEPTEVLKSCPPSLPPGQCNQYEPDEVYYDGTQVTTGDDPDPANFYSYTEYGDAIDPPFTPPAGSEYGRRMLKLPVTQCTGEENGQSTLTVHGFVCFFLLQKIQQGSGDQEIFGEYVENCTTGGLPGTEPGSGPGPYRIQLYRDPDSADS